MEVRGISGEGGKFVIEPEEMQRITDAMGISPNFRVMNMAKDTRKSDVGWELERNSSEGLFFVDRIEGLFSPIQIGRAHV